MAGHIGWLCSCVLAAVFCAMLHLVQSQDCTTEKMENVTIDIKAALSKGIRGTDPVHTASWETCVNICCLGKNIAKNKKCNLVIFNARRKGNFPNCYLFHCPTKEACPMKQGIGLVTYRMAKDTPVLKPTPSPKTLSHFVTNGSLVPPQTTVLDDSHRLTSPSNQSGPLQKSITSEMMEILAHIQKHLDAIDGHSLHPKIKGLNHSKSLDSSSMHDITNTLPPVVINTVPHLVPAVQTTVKLPSLTTGAQAGSVAVMAPRVSPSNAKTTGSTTFDHRSPDLATVIPRRSTTPVASTLDLFLSSPPSKITPASLPDIHFSDGPLELEGSGPNRTLDKTHFGDKSVLFAALFFGVMFLLFATVLVGRKMLESLQQRRYTRLDYLINGMYTSV